MEKFLSKIKNALISGLIEAGAIKKSVWTNPMLYFRAITTKRIWNYGYRFT